MAKDLENIGIRSDKPIVIRYGTTIIAALLLSVAVVAFYIIKKTALTCMI